MSAINSWPCRKLFLEMKVFRVSAIALIWIHMIHNTWWHAHFFIPVWCSVLVHCGVSVYHYSPLMETNSPDKLFIWINTIKICRHQHHLVSNSLNSSEFFSFCHFHISYCIEMLPSKDLHKSKSIISVFALQTSTNVKYKKMGFIFI